MRPSIFSTLLMAAVLALPLLSHAERADRTKPMNIEADNGTHDELKQTSVFTGNVVVTKGTIIIRGAQLTVSQDRDGYQHGVVTAAPGKLAFFRQKRDTAPGAPSEFVEGEGEVITYNGRDDTVHFERRGELRRYRETTLTDQVSGSVIVYNNLTDTFTVNGQKGEQTAETKPGAPKNGRVRVILTPKADEKADAKADAGKAKPAADDKEKLRPSTQLNDGAK
ncbi:lipopolysaccharide transport periplasmic protein LptA [Comamonas odontotermitis]|uniref:lipopolysaccharide transport periplasmic protein LptA n=1 Tax=Comamonas TaxID=283 RepID=UPI001CC3DB80|nr:lipopolysaccharide transport periplasmic protein LptA [Comamonas odontotermitis]UBB19360.1 lipopolysaccharide transport periplasmic protein LptA [Comamonas odontotermitis]